MNNAILRRTLRAIITAVLLLTVIAEMLFLTGCNSVRSENQILKDIIEVDDDLAKMDSTKTITVTKRQTWEIEKIDYVWVTVTVENEMYLYEGKYNLRYGLYNDGWYLDRWYKLDSRLVGYQDNITINGKNVFDDANERAKDFFSEMKIEWPIRLANVDYHYYTESIGNDTIYVNYELSEKSSLVKYLGEYIVIKYVFSIEECAWIYSETYFSDKAYPIV